MSLKIHLKGKKVLKNKVDGAELWQSCFTVFPSSQLSFLSHPHFTPDVSLTQKSKSLHIKCRIYGGILYGETICRIFTHPRPIRDKSSVDWKGDYWEEVKWDFLGIFPVLFGVFILYSQHLQVPCFLLLPLNVPEKPSCYKAEGFQVRMSDSDWVTQSGPQFYFWVFASLYPSPAPCPLPVPLQPETHQSEAVDWGARRQNNSYMSFSHPLTSLDFEAWKYYPQ